MQDIQFPVKLDFKISTLSNDFTAYDTNGKVIAYVKQKLFKLKEDISVYDDDSKSKVNYKIRANKWLDFNTAYDFYNSENTTVSFGKVVRKGWKSIWKAEYQVIDDNEKIIYQINEENPWTKVLDNLLGQIPFVGVFTGYLFNPSYILKDMQDKSIVRLKKQPSFWGRKFEIDALNPLNGEDDDRILLSLMMMILLERHRG